VTTPSSTEALAPELPLLHSNVPWRRQAIGALDGSAFSIPASLGAATLVFSHVGLEFLPAAILALMIALVITHLAAAHSPQPVVYSARFFEATTLAAMMDQVIAQLPVWGLPATPGVRLAMLCLVVASSGWVVGMLYMLRADRFTRFIPAPVFAGFASSIALALLMSQARTLWTLLEGKSPIAAVLTIVAAVLVIALGLRRLRPRWPGTAIALVAGLLLGVAWSVAGRGTPVIGAFGWVTHIPATLADFRALGGPDVRLWPLAAMVATCAGVLGTMMFINTTMAAQGMTPSDDLRERRRRDALWPVLAMTLGGALGSLPLSGSMQASAIASRQAPLAAVSMRFCALAAALVYLSGLVGLIPLAAVCGALLAEAWQLIHRPSMRMLAAWALRRRMTPNDREDLALVMAVIAAAVLINMVAAVLVGLLCGLVLFAARNAKRPVRNVWTGLQLASNCARSRSDLAVLAKHGAAIRVIELEGDLFFGMTDILERFLANQAPEGALAVLDWSRVRHIDSSTALAMARYEQRCRARGFAPVHAGADVQGDEVLEVLRGHMPDARFAPDRDRALEIAENELIARHGHGTSAQATALLEAAALFKGLDDTQRALLDAAMVQRRYAAGDTILRAGEPGDEMMLVLHGSASIVVTNAEGRQVRLAGVRRGGTLGEIAFLDRSTRSATVVAEEETLVAVLEHADFDALGARDPRIVQRLLSNLAVNLAARLRHTNELALARQLHR
jgi:SulP family sulfate permease